MEKDSKLTLTTKANPLQADLRANLKQAAQQALDSWDKLSLECESAISKDEEILKEMKILLVELKVKIDSLTEGSK